jgi:hypothetical protein
MDLSLRALQMIPPSSLVLFFSGWPGRSSIARLDEALLRARFGEQEDDQATRLIPPSSLVNSLGNGTRVATTAPREPLPI